MSDMGEFYFALREARRKRRVELGVNCPGCIKKFPKRNPTLLLPAQKCKVCQYIDPRPDTRRKS